MWSDLFINRNDQPEEDFAEDLETLEGRYLISSTIEYQKQLAEGRVPVERKEPVKIDVDKRPRPWREEK